MVRAVHTVWAVVMMLGCASVQTGTELQWTEGGSEEIIAALTEERSEPAYAWQSVLVDSVLGGALLWGAVASDQAEVVLGFFAVSGFTRPIIHFAHGRADRAWDSGFLRWLPAPQSVEANAETYYVVETSLDGLLRSEQREASSETTTGPEVKVVAIVMTTRGDPAYGLGLKVSSW